MKTANCITCSKPFEYQPDNLMRAGVSSRRHIAKIA